MKLKFEEEFLGAILCTMNDDQDCRKKLRVVTKFD